MGSGVIVERQGQLTYLVKVKSHLYSIQIKTVQNRVVHHYFAQHSSDGNSVFYAGKTVCESCWRLVYGNTSFLPWSKHLQLESFSAEDKDYHSLNIANYMQLIDWELFVDKVGDCVLIINFPAPAIMPN